ncbi:hypothetical protein [Jatrophihabitans fulvus]
MAWLPIAAWIAAVVLGALVIGFCAYELLWKVKRLQRDVRRLTELTAELQTVQVALVHGLTDAKQRLAEARVAGGTAAPEGTA